MKTTSIKYYFGEAFASLIHNRLMSFASILTVSSCILIMCLTYSLAINLEHLLHHLENKVGISVFMEKDLELEKIEEIGNRLYQIEGVKDVHFISSEDAMKTLTEDMDISFFQDVLDESPLKNSYVIYTEKIENQASIIQTIENMNLEISHVKHAESESKMIMMVGRGIRLGSIVMIGILSIMSVIIIFNTIKISVHNRENEISIMKLVGASDWFIRWPFIIEGALLGFLGVLFPLCIAYFAYEKTISFIQSSFNQLNYLIFIEFVSTMNIFRLLLPASFIFGITLGVFGSILSIRKYLKV